MDFLNKLYESNYFGIGLFAVISFLVIMFLIVLFFGKKDAKKRKLEETNKLEVTNNNAFKETTEPVSLEVKEEPTLEQAPVEPVMPINPIETEPITEPIISNTPEVIEKVEEPLQPVEPLKPVEVLNPVETVAPVEPVPVTPIIEEPVVPIINDTKELEPISEPLAPVEPLPITNEEERVITPLEPIIPDASPVFVEPTKITIPEEPVPVVEEPVKIELEPANNPAPPVIVEDTVIGDTYYKPVEQETPTEVKVPNIDFNALAKSISEELDELEKASPVTVTPLNEVAKPESTIKEFSSVYVDAPKRPTPVKTPIDLPKKIDLPKRIDE